ncbi:lambda exonuclease family protein [Pseudoxanthomonas winnipegensis]|uniref:lambda exonuclease family protein n=1 Tax=Pseudoxanthomonas winnipegensis TaxID=2480810 RepID=UPI00102DE424|nr:lambda exonuclease family protein [Pseudoxanthomonas winnipegensis]RZZ85651.1 exonuclease [Pseudoxanthomonas winnipegensis]
MIQGTDEWLALRTGKLTGSRFADLMAVTRSGPSASRANLIVAVALERLTGEPEQTFQNDAMRRGTALEPFARGAYEALTGELVEQVSFVTHPSLDFVGVSPDGLIGDDGLIEVKCPASQHKHLLALRDGSHAKEYRWQIQGQLWVTGRQWCDAVSYDPRFPSGLQLAITRVQRDEKAIKELEQACIEADAEIKAIGTELINMRSAA